MIVDPAAGGRIAALRVDGLDLLVNHGYGPLAWGAYPMVPWAGRLRDGLLAFDGRVYPLPTHLLPPHAIHGTLVEATWDVETPVGPTGAVLRAPLGATWPFGGHAVHHVALAADSLDRSGWRSTPTPGPSPPSPDGTHGSGGRSAGRREPRAGPVEIGLRADGMLLRGEDGLPTGEVGPVPPGPWDDCFVGVTSPPLVRWPGAFEIALESDAAYWVVYTEHADGVCVEPQTGPPNGLNTGAYTLVEPGRPLTASMTLRWRRLA